MDTKQAAEAFSNHRFSDVYDRLADTVRWVVPGQASIDGKADVVAACESAAAEFSELAGTDVLRFVSLAEERRAAVEGTDSLLSSDKARDLLGFVPEYSWRTWGDRVGKQD